MSFIKELKRRNVIRVGIAYAVAAWLLIEITATTFPILKLPDWSVPLVTVLVLIGFPLALIFAWAYELTPEGLKKEKDVDRSESITHITGRKLDFAIIAVLAVALVFFASTHQWGSETGNAEIADKSIAVLAFADLSPEGDQEYFSDGISEELLNVLAKIPDLRVAARTSSFQFKGENRDAVDIGQQLNVAMVLEGSVRKAGVQLRITAQLIDASSGFHLWSQTYDRELANVFAVQDEISAAIVEALKEHLGLQVEVAHRVAWTTTPEAYQNFLLGRNLIHRRTQPLLEQAVERFQVVLAADPDYAPAWVGLAEATILLADSQNTWGNLSRQEVVARATPALERALALDPDLADAYMARGLMYSGQGRHEEALADYDRAIALNSNLARAHKYRSNLLMDDLGRFRDATAGLETALGLDPLSVVANGNMANALSQQSRFEEARVYIDRVMALNPTLRHGYLSDWYWTKGDYAGAVIEFNQALTTDPTRTRYRLFLAFQLNDLGLSSTAQPWLGDQADFALTAQARHTEALEHLQNLFLRRPDDAFVITRLAWGLLNAGDADGAIRQFRRLYDVNPQQILGFLGIPNALFNARALELTGDDSGATAQITGARAEIDRRRGEGLDNAGLDFDDSMVLANEGRTNEALAMMNQALDRGLLIWAIDVLPIPVEFLTHPGFQAIRDRHNTERTREKAAINARLCGPASDIPDHEYKTAICAALVGS